MNLLGVIPDRSKPNPVFLEESMHRSIEASVIDANTKPAFRCLLCTFLNLIWNP